MSRGVRRDAVDRRSHARRPAPRAQLIAVPLRPNARPDWDNRVTGLLIDSSPVGLGIDLTFNGAIRSTQMIVGVSYADQPMQYAGFNIRNSSVAGPGRLRVGGLMGGLPGELLRDENLTPTLQPQTMSYRMGFPEDLLEAWAEVGVLEQTLHDRVQLCPRCHGLPTFRNGCRNCGSSRTVNDRLIHHFACAFVGLVGDFETPAGLVCPKCRARGLVIGADYEYLNGPYRCEECEWGATELEHVGQCLRCRLRFPVHQAFELHLRGYRVRRLDPLALLQAA
jgi:hypothetical protein